MLKIVNISDKLLIAFTADVKRAIEVFHLFDTKNLDRINSKGNNNGTFESENRF